MSWLDDYRRSLTSLDPRDHIDPPEAQCERCGAWFEFDPLEHLDCDGESTYVVPPTCCEECTE